MTARYRRSVDSCSHFGMRIVGSCKRAWAYCELATS